MEITSCIYYDEALLFFTLKKLRFVMVVVSSSRSLNRQVRKEMCSLGIAGTLFYHTPIVWGGAVCWSLLGSGWAFWVLLWACGGKFKHLVVFRTCLFPVLLERNGRQGAFLYFLPWCPLVSVSSCHTLLAHWPQKRVLTHNVYMRNNGPMPAPYGGAREVVTPYHHTQIPIQVKLYLW